MWLRIISFFAWLSSLWNNLSEEDKEKIINQVVEVFTDLLKLFYRACKKSES